MGLFKDIVTGLSFGLLAVPKILGSVTKRITPLLTAAQPLLQAAAPFARAAIAVKTGGLIGGFPGAGAGGAGPVGQFAQLQQRPPLGFLGSQSPFANPIARAQFFPAFNPATIPARPLTFQNAQIAAFQQQQFPTFGQATSFNQGAFGQSVGPSFRPFASSFRSGGFGFSGGFRPGFSRGLAVSAADPFGRQAPSQAFDPFFQEITSRTPQQFGFAAPRGQRFAGGGFGGFGGFAAPRVQGFGGFTSFGGFGGFF